MREALALLNIRLRICVLSNFMSFYYEYEITT
jgi:hypothetical protein